MSVYDLFSRGYTNKDNTKKLGNNEVRVSEILLDEQQSDVVYTTEPNAIVVAGAGSGKTRVLTSRVKYLIETLKVPAHNIVCITFTNLAAEEMKLRLSNVIGIGDAFIGTIHSFANHIMKESGEKYKIYNDDLDNLLCKELIEKYCTHLTMDRYLDYKDLQSLIEVGKASKEELNNFFMSSEQCDFNLLTASVDLVEEDLKNETHITFGESVWTLCKKRGIITFDELLKKAEKYFNNLNASVDYVFVDEFQDVGTLEYKFINSLHAKNYFFVGDDYQSIFGFKGGNVKIFLGLVDSDKFKTYYLTNNYRNSTEIIKLASTVIQQVNNKIPKGLNPMTTEIGEFSVMSKGNIHSVLKTLVRTEENFKDWFLLVRTNKELYDIINLCIDYDISYTTFKREGMSLSDINKRLNSNKLKVLTVHTSKGLEIDNVILYGNFPVVTPPYRCNDDERKVMYVGVTRARKRLIILN